MQNIRLSRRDKISITTGCAGGYTVKYGTKIRVEYFYPQFTSVEDRELFIFLPLGLNLMTLGALLFTFSLAR